MAAPTLFVVARRDVLATPSMVLGHYRSVPTTVPEYDVEFANAAHILSSNMGNNYEGRRTTSSPSNKAYVQDDNATWRSSMHRRGPTSPRTGTSLSSGETSCFPEVEA